MLKNIKKSIKTFKTHTYELLTVSVAFAFLIYLTIMLSFSLFGGIGIIIGFVFIIIQLLIGLKYTVYNTIVNQKVEYKNMKVGFITYSRSMKLYLLTIIKPLFLSCFMFLILSFMTSGLVVGVLNSADPNFLVEASNMENIQAIIDANPLTKQITQIGLVISSIISIVTFFVAKANRNFMPLMAFEIPLNVVKAEEMNKKITKEKKWTYFFNRLAIYLLFFIPLFVVLLFLKFVLIGDTLQINTVVFVILGVFMLIASPIFTFLQISDVHAYREQIKPYEDDFKKEMDSILKEILEVMDEINKKDD